MMGQHRVLRGALKAALHLLYPAQCLGCGCPVAAPEGGAVALCPECWRETRFISGACCDCCGVPLPDDGSGTQETLACDDCLDEARPWQRGRAAITYAGTGRRLVLSFKHGDRPDMAPHLASWLSQAAAPLAQPGMIVAPIPLHWFRLFKRRYNQAALLSAPVAGRLGLDHMTDLLVRQRHTRSQGQFDRVTRRENLANALAVNPRRIAALQGRPLLLIDDVLASGATMDHATRALLDAGSGPVCVAVLARAVKDD